MPTYYPLRGAIQAYAWGGYDFIPALLGKDNTAHEPYAELWLGTHPKGMAQAQIDGEWIPLADLIARDPVGMLGQAVADRFDNQLPYLFKVLDVRQMLSIQAHPTLEAARRGFARENEAGIPVSSSERTYRDANHKPEVMVALTDFWLLHGFREEAAIEDTLRELPGWHILEPTFIQAGMEGLYEHVMTAPQTEVDDLLQPLHDLLQQQAEQLTNPDDPAYWAWRAFQQYSQQGHHDRGLFSIYWLNLVPLSAGQGIFQAANVPHAYLQGSCIELMANSDNVFRGGLTQKYIDIEQLLDNVRFTAVQPRVLTGQQQGMAIDYEVPVPDFALARIVLPAHTSFSAPAATGPLIYLVIEGEVHHDQQKIAKRGDSFFVPAAPHFSFQSPTGAVLFRASTSVM